MHYDGQPQRRPLLQRLVADGLLQDAYATDDGVGLLYRETQFVEALSELPDVAAYRIARNASGQAVETRIEPRRLPVD